MLSRPAQSSPLTTFRSRFRSYVCAPAPVLPSSAPPFFSLQLKGKSALLDWDYEPKWRDVKTGQKEPIEVLVKMVDELARKHKDLIPMEMVEIYPSASADKR